jgi:hypothetical protein
MTIYVSSKNLVDSTSKIAEILSHFDNWCKENGLDTNYNKTKCLIIRKPQTKITTEPKLFIGENEIECDASFNYLRVYHI